MTKKSRQKRKQKKESMKNEIEALIARANNSSFSHSMAGQRLAGLISGGYDFADTMHNIYLDFGYPPHVKFFHFWNTYRRFGIAKTVIDLPVEFAWSTLPLFSESTNERLINDIKRLDKRVKFWSRIKTLDKRKRLGRYAGMFMRVADDKKPSEPLEGNLGGESALVDMMPLYESQLEVISDDEDPTSPNFGKPILLQYSQAVVGNRNEESRHTFNIHASRIVFAREGDDDGSIYGISELESIYNALMDLQKIAGAGAEGLYKNASQSVVVGIDPTASGKVSPEIMAQLGEQYDDWNRNRSRKAFAAGNASVNPLQSSMVSPKPMFDNSMAIVAAGSKIPSTIIIGMQTGERASTEDSKQFLSTIQSRRINDTTQLIKDHIDWCINWGVLPSNDYGIEWDDLLAMSIQDQLKNASIMTAINKDAFSSGGDAIYTENEIRVAGGSKPLDELETDGEDDIDNDIVDDIPDDAES